MNFVYVNKSDLRKRKITRIFRIKRNSRILFLDADGVLWPDEGPGTILKGPEIFESAINLISKFKHDHKGEVAIITNQTAAARGIISLTNLSEFIKNFFHRINSVVKITLVYVCFHHPNADEPSLMTECCCRKPKPGGILEVSKFLGANPCDSFLVGDRITDIVASNESGILYSFLLYSEQMFMQNVNQSERSFYNARSSIFLPVATLAEVESEIAKIVQICK